MEQGGHTLAWRMRQFPPRALVFLVCSRSVAEICPSPLAAFGDAVAKIRQAGDHFYHSSRAPVWALSHVRSHGQEHARLTNPLSIDRRTLSDGIGGLMRSPLASQQQNAHRAQTRGRDATTRHCPVISVTQG